MAWCPTAANRCWIAVHDGPFRQQLGEAVLHLGRHQAGAQKGRHALQFRHHKAARHTAVLIQRHPTGAPAVGLKQPPRHRDFAPKGQPLLVRPLLEAIYGALANHGLGRRFAGLGQLQKARPSGLVQRRAQPGDRLSKRRRIRSLLQLPLPLTDIFFQIRHTDREIFRIFHLGSPSGMESNVLSPKYFRARNRDPIFFGTCVNQNLHPFQSSEKLGCQVHPYRIGTKRTAMSSRRSTS